MRRSDHDKEAVAKNARPAQVVRFRAQIFWILILALSVNSGATADYKASYSKGLKALENENWLEAADWFQNAIKEKPQAGGKIRIPGQKKKRLYVPYYQLGLAFYHADALREASKAWRESMLQGALRKDPNMQEQVNRYTAAIDVRLDQELSAPPAPKPQPKLPEEKLADTRRWVEEQLERAKKQIFDLDEPDLQATLAANPSLRDRRREGVEKLRLAREIYEGGDPGELEAAHALAVEAAGILEDVVFNVTRLTREKP